MTTTARGVPALPRRDVRGPEAHTPRPDATSLSGYRRPPPRREGPADPQGGSKGYTVRNSGTYKDKMSLTEALATSPNTGF
ncbi:hypothetical protein, partial [Actinosynnema sp. NPDC020468]|uniref:hypothetical protein n=1 Tax=Actinosynnema sp. NPDC020468 TaxID=3154488 RepID=UPI0033CD0658